MKDKIYFKFRIIKDGEDKPFTYHGKKMLFLTKNGAIFFLRDYLEPKYRIFCYKFEIQEYKTNPRPYWKTVKTFIDIKPRDVTSE